VLPLYARLSARDQDRVFHPGGQRRIVLATNVAETSLTVPRIHYVVDPGYARVKRYSPRQKLDRLHIEEVSQASANQRMGRCGRIAPGICYR
jgi:ATP-dependent helicase HrpA